MNILKYLFSSIFLLFLTSPVYSTGYEDISLSKTILQLVFYIIAFIAVIFITVYGTKFIAKNYKGLGNSKYMNVVDVLNIQNGIKLVMVNINNKIYILSVTSTGTTVIDTIDPKDLEEEKFNNYLNKYINKNHTEDTEINLYINKIKEKIKFSKDKEDRR